MGHPPNLVRAQNLNENSVVPFKKSSKKPIRRAPAKGKSLLIVNKKRIISKTRTFNLIVNLFNRRLKFTPPFKIKLSVIKKISCIFLPKKI